MKVDSSNISQYYQEFSASFSEKLDKKEDLNAKDVTTTYFFEFQKQTLHFSRNETDKQAKVFTLADIGYDGKPIGKLTQDEAKSLVSEDGFFGIKATSERIGNFVLNGAGDSIEMLKAGRDGLLKGFNEAQKLWGGKLPDISQETIKKAVDIVDAKIKDLGASIIDTQA